MQSYTLLLVKHFWIRKFIPIFAQFTKKRAMIKENFIKLYENSFRENWDLPCYTDYGEDTQYRFGMIDDMMNVIRRKILKDRDNDRSVCDRCHIGDAPMSVIFADN